MRVSLSARLGGLSLFSVFGHFRFLFVLFASPLLCPSFDIQFQLLLSRYDSSPRRMPGSPFGGWHLCRFTQTHKCAHTSWHVSKVGVWLCLLDIGWHLNLATKQTNPPNDDDRHELIYSMYISTDPPQSVTLKQKLQQNVTYGFNTDSPGYKAKESAMMCAHICVSH